MGLPGGARRDAILHTGGHVRIEPHATRREGQAHGARRPRPRGEPDEGGALAAVDIRRRSGRFARRTLGRGGGRAGGCCGRPRGRRQGPLARDALDRRRPRRGLGSWATRRAWQRRVCGARSGVAVPDARSARVAGALGAGRGRRNGAGSNGISKTDASSGCSPCGSSSRSRRIWSTPSRDRRRERGLGVRELPQRARVGPLDRARHPRRHDDRAGGQGARSRFAFTLTSLPACSASCWAWGRVRSTRSASRSATPATSSRRPVLTRRGTPSRRSTGSARRWSR